MRHRFRPVAMLTLAGGLALLLAGCGGSSGSANASAGATPGASGSAGLAKKTATAGPVQVQVTPQRIGAGGARFQVVLDNHEIELTGDYAKGSTLSVASTAWGPATWSGDGPGGHHREGTLTFRASGAPAGPVVLRLAGLPKPVTLSWPATR